MQHSIEPLSDRARNRVTLAQVGNDQACARGNRHAVPALEVVEHHDFVTREEQLPGDDRADVSSAAGNQQLHRSGTSEVNVSAMSLSRYNRPRIAASQDAIAAMARARSEHELGQ